MSNNGFDITLSNPKQAGVFFVLDDDISPLETASNNAGLLLRQINLLGCTSKTCLLERMHDALDIPDEQGSNWDALSDQLRDLAWLPSDTGYSLLFSHAESLRNKEENSFETLLDILDESMVVWQERNIPFWAFLALPGPEMPAVTDTPR